MKHRRAAEYLSVPYVSDEEFSKRTGYDETEAFINEILEELRLPDPREVYPEWFLQAEQHRLEQSAAEHRILAEALDDAFYERLEKAGGVRFCNMAKGAIASVYMFAQGWRQSECQYDLLKAITKTAGKLRDLLKAGQIDGRLAPSSFDCGMVTLLNDLLELKTTTLQHSKRTGRPAKRLGPLGLELLEIFEGAGGTIRFNRKDRESYNGPCADLLREFWRRMPADLRPGSPETFIDYTKKEWIQKRKRISSSVMPRGLSNSV